jgi:hypothetical protein
MAHGVDLTGGIEAGVVLGMVPITVTLIAVAFLREKLSGVRLPGIVVAVTGAVGVNVMSAHSPGASPNAWLGAPVSGALLAVPLLGEDLRLHHVAGIVLAVGGSTSLPGNPERHRRQRRSPGQATWARRRVGRRRVEERLRCRRGYEGEPWSALALTYITGDVDRRDVVAAAGTYIAVYRWATFGRPGAPCLPKVSHLRGMSNRSIVVGGPAAPSSPARRGCAARPTPSTSRRSA